MTIYIKRIYDPVGLEDGKRVLIDRLWPRGVSKERANWDQWIKEAAPTNELRKWFAHQEDRFDLFRERYEEELETDPKTREAIMLLLQDASKGNLTLLTSSKSETCTHSVILRDFLLRAQS